MSKSYRERLNDSIDVINTQLEISFGIYSAIDAEELNHVPDPRSWSIIQILNHLYISEQLTIRYLEYKKQSGAFIPDFNLKNRINTFILYIAFISPFKYKAPESNGLNTPSNIGDIESLFEIFMTQRMKLKNFIDQIPEEAVKKAWFKHPYAGRMDLIRMLWFFRFHFKRHHKQILKLLAQAKEQN